MSASRALTCLGRLTRSPFAAALIALSLSAPTQAHEGPHEAAPFALLQHALSAPDHWLASFLMLAAAGVLGITAVRLWIRAARTPAGGARRGLATACMAASGLLIWSATYTGVSAMF